MKRTEVAMHVLRNPPPHVAGERLSAPPQFSTPPGGGVADAQELQRQILRLQEQARRQEAELSYQRLQDQIVAFIHLAVPRGSTMLVVSKGDERLIDAPGRRGWHFPRAVNGLYAGCYPANSREAIEHLRKLQAEGATHLVIPSPSYWWLEFYRGLARHLQRRHRLIAYHEEVCLAFKLLNAAGDAKDGCSAAANGHLKH